MGVPARVLRMRSDLEAGVIHIPEESAIAPQPARVPRYALP